MLDLGFFYAFPEITAAIVGTRGRSEVVAVASIHLNPGRR